jgi:hypothetical protein
VDRHADILYRLARFLAGIPPEVLGAMVLLGLQHPGLVAALFTTAGVVLKFVVVAIVFVSKIVASVIVDGVVAWYLGKMFTLHVWPRLPHGLRRFVLKQIDRMLIIPADQDQAATSNGESAVSRNSKRHPHW